MARSKGSLPDRCIDPLSLRGLQDARASVSDQRASPDGRRLTHREELFARRLSDEKYATAVILLHGAPPPHPESNDLIVFGGYLHDLSEWTQRARESMFDLWGINEVQYENSSMYREAFDRLLHKWYHELTYREIDDEGT